MTTARAIRELDILSLAMQADDRRRQLLPHQQVSYTRVHVIKDAPALEIPVPAAARELRIVELPATLDQAVAAVRTARQLANERLVAAFSLARLIDASRAGWGDLDDVLASLAGAGLHDLAEVPVDEIDDLAAVVATARGAGLAVRRLTVTHAASGRDVELLDRVRRCHELAPIKRFAPLPRIVPADKPTTGYQDLRMVALSRLVLSDPSLPPISIEVDWSMYGPKLAQVALTFGADHLDAVPATSDDTLGRRRGTIEELERNIRAAGFEPREDHPAT